MPSRLRMLVPVSLGLQGIKPHCLRIEGFGVWEVGCLGCGGAESEFSESACVFRVEGGSGLGFRTWGFQDLRRFGRFLRVLSQSTSEPLVISYRGEGGSLEPYTIRPTQNRVEAYVLRI